VLALVTKSANDAAVVVAEFLGGTESNFAATMTRKARELGLTQTEFRNASGLPIAGQWSTPRDMAILARSLIHVHVREYHYFATREFDFHGEMISTHNHLLGSYEGADGIKTGYIASAGFNLVASAKRDGHRLIGVVFGGHSVGSRDRQMVALLDAGFAREAGAARIDTAKIDQPEGDAAPVPSTEAEAEDPEVAAVMMAMADSQGIAGELARPAPTGAGDAEEEPWGVQLGSFHQRARAERLAGNAARRLGDLVGDGHVAVVPAAISHATVFRAMLIGLTEPEARRACAKLGHRFGACRVINTVSDLPSR
jgi:D-alanyl-D-alanine carboxypeptidase